MLEGRRDAPVPVEKRNMHQNMHHKKNGLPMLILGRPLTYSFC